MELKQRLPANVSAVPKLDAWSHAIPKPYLERLNALPAGGPHTAVSTLVQSTPSLFDMDQRFRTMDRFGTYSQVLTPLPGLHLTMALGNRRVADELVRL